MAEFEKKKHAQDEFNKGNKYVANDGVQPATINNLVENSLYTEAFAESLASTPDTTNVAQVGTPSVELVDNPSAGITGAKKFKFKNLKGEPGRTIIPAENGSQTITYEQLKAYAAATSETYTISNSSDYNVGDVAIISYTISDRNNTRGSVFVKVTSWDMTSIVGRGLGMSVAGEDSLFYNGYLELPGWSIEGVAQNVVELVKANFNRGPEEDDCFSLVIKTTETQDDNVVAGENGTYFCLCEISNVPIGDTCTADVNYHVKISGEDGEDGITPLTYKSTIEIASVNLVIGHSYTFVTTSFARANTAAIPVAGEVFLAIVESGNSAANMGLFQVNSSVGAETSCKLLSLTRIRGDAGAEVELRATDDYIQWKYDSSTTWTNLISLSTLKGDDGKNVELQKTTNYIQWRNVGDAAWQNLVALSELKGENGQTPTIGENGNWYIGDTNTNVKAAGANGTTFTPSVDADGNLSWTNDGSLENPETVNIKGAQGESATVQVGTVTTGAAGTNASVTNSGTENAAVFNFTIPKGEAGVDGTTPHIGANGNWFIGDTDTNVKAAGEKGEDGEDYLFYSQVTDDAQAPNVGKSYGISSTYFNRVPVVDDTFLMMVHDTSADISYLCSAKVTSETAAQILDIMELGGGSSKTILPVIYSPISIQLDAIKTRIATGSQDYYDANNLSDFSSGDIGIVNVNIYGIEEGGTVAGKLIILVTDAGGGAVGQRVGGRTIGYTYAPSGAESGIQQNEVINRTQPVDFANANTADFVEISGTVWAKMPSGNTGTVYTISSAAAMDTPTLPSATASRCRQIGNNAYIFTDNSAQPCVKFDMSTEQLTNTSFAMSQAFNPYAMQVAEINDKIYVLSSSDIVEVSESGTDVSQTTYSWSGTAPSIYYSAAAEYGNYVYLFGGINSSFTGLSSSIIKVDIPNKSATTLSVSLPKAIGAPSVITVGSNIYIFGGATALEGRPTDTLSDSIYKFDAETETISTLDCVLPGGAGVITLCAKGTSIYLIGGEYASGKTNKIYEFDTLSEALYDTRVVCPYNNSNGSCASTDTAIYKFLGDDTGDGGNSDIITKIGLSAQSSSGFEYKRLALYSEIENGGGGDSPASNIVDIGSVDVDLGEEIQTQLSLSSDVLSSLTSDTTSGIKLSINGGWTFFATKIGTQNGQVVYECSFIPETTTVWDIRVAVFNGGAMLLTSQLDGKFVYANHGTNEATQTLEKLTVGNTTYSIPSGSGGSVTKNDVLQVLGISETQLNTLIALLGKTSVSDSTGVTFSAPVNTTQYFNVNEQ